MNATTYSTIPEHYTTYYANYQP